MSDRLLTIAAWLYVHGRSRWRSALELVGLALLVAAAACFDGVVGLASAGVALLVFAAFGARGS